MKSRNSRWIKLMGIGAFSAVLLSSGAGPAAAVTTCKAQFVQVTPIGPATPRLCISYDPFIGRFDEALAWCRNIGGRVATYGDFYYIYRYTNRDANFNANGKWMGPDLVGDDQALCGNADITYDGDPDMYNFEGTCSKWDIRLYWCTHDLD